MNHYRKISYIFGVCFLGLSAHAVNFEILELGDGNGNPGTIRLQSRYTNKETNQEEPFFLETLKEEDFPALISIRDQEPVYKSYGDHRKPSPGEVEEWLHTKLLPRVGGKESVFPFVLKDKNNTVKGLINVGFGYEKDHRMLGVYTCPGEQHEKDKYEEWGKGRGKAAVHTAGDFMMLWHKDHPEHQIVNFMNSSVKLWGDVFSTLSATSDADNLGGRIILEKFGMQIIPALKIRGRHYNDIGNKVYYELSDYNQYEQAKKQRE